MSKYQEDVLVLPKEFFNPKTFTGSAKEFADIVNKHGRFLIREQAEKDENYMQIIPYVILSYQLDEEGKDVFLFTYKRLKAGSEARLHENYSIGIGGHIEQSKDFSEGNMSLARTIGMAAIREIREETSVYAQEDNLFIPNDKFLIYDDSNEVGRVHLGLLMQYRLNDMSVMPKEINKIEGKLVNVNSLLTEPYNFENWTSMALKLLFS